MFYVHPTTAMREDVRNASLDDADANHMADDAAHQATPFNAVARVYAALPPDHLSTYALDAGEQDPLNLVTPTCWPRSDTTRRTTTRAPFFLVGHSGDQPRPAPLLEAIGAPMEDLLVAAYLPGQPIPRAFFGTT